MENCRFNKIISKNGFTFIEIMIACILMVIVFFIGKAISNGFGGVKKVRNYETAISLANQAIEAVRAARSVDLGVSKVSLLKDKNNAQKNTLVSDFASAKDTFDENYDGFVPVVEVDGVMYKRTVTIEDIKSTNKNIETGLKTIRVLVEWKAAEDGKPAIFEVVTAHCDLW